MMTLWSIFRSPLMFGGDLPSNDPATLALITNPEVLAVDQHSTAGREVYRTESTIAWLADKPAQKSGAAHYVAIFNISSDPQKIDLAFPDVGLPKAKLPSATSGPTRT